MSDEVATFRANVGAVIADGADRVLVFERADVRGAWQFPQGGMRVDEEPLEAIERELREETGLDSARLQLIATRSDWLTYELPEGNRSKKTGRGQVQKWFLYRLVGDTDITLPTGSDAEFVNARWVAIDEPVGIIVDFKRPTYCAVMSWADRELRDGLGELTPEGREYAMSELDHVSTAILSNEDMGERRVANLVTLIALLATAVGLVVENLGEATEVQKRSIAFFAAMTALAAGWLTFLRILKRNVHTTDLQFKATEIRSALTRLDPVAAEIVPFGAPRAREVKWHRPGLAETTIVVNSVVVATSVGLVADHSSDSWALTIVIAAASIVPAVIVQDRFARRRYRAAAETLGWPGGEERKSVDRSQVAE